MLRHQEWPKLLDAAKKEQESSKGELELRMHGWTVKPEFFEAGYKKLNDLGLKVVEHYRDILRHVTVVDAGAGYTHSCALTVPGTCVLVRARMSCVVGSAHDTWQLLTKRHGVSVCVCVCVCACRVCL